MSQGTYRVAITDCSPLGLQTCTPARLLNASRPRGEACVHEKIAALQEEIRRDIDSLVAQKQEIMQMIGQLSKPEYQTVLELRYLRGWTIKRIAMNMHFTIYYVYELHTNALKEFSSIIKSP